MGAFQQRVARAIYVTLTVVGAMLLAGCSGDGDGAGGGGDDADDRAAVEKVFRDYSANLANRDFEAACEQNAPETTDRLLENLQSTDIEASTCEEAYAKVYATPEAGALLDQIAATIEVQSVTVDAGGETASITWSAETNGRRVPVTSTMRRVDGEWKLVDVD